MPYHDAVLILQSKRTPHTTRRRVCGHAGANPFFRRRARFSTGDVIALPEWALFRSAFVG